MEIYIWLSNYLTFHVWRGDIICYALCWTVLLLVVAKRHNQRYFSYTCEGTKICRRTEEEVGRTVGLPRHRHFVGFFNVPVHLRLFREVVPFQWPFTTGIRIRRTFSHLKPRGPTGARAGKGGVFQNDVKMYLLTIKMTTFGLSYPVYDNKCKDTNIKHVEQRTRVYRNASFFLNQYIAWEHFKPCMWNETHVDIIIKQSISTLSKC